MVLLLTSESGSGGGSSVTLDLEPPADPPTTGLHKDFCLWKDCPFSSQPILNLLEHIQTKHVVQQTKAEGYVCLWEGCKVYGKKSSSLSWIERHVLSHGGNKPFGCFFPGCGLTFGSQGALERHVNSHITTNGTTLNTNGLPLARKLDSSPSKSSRRKKLKGRKQKIQTGQFVDYFDKRTIEVIKYRLARAVHIEEESTHHCTFTSQVLSRRMCPLEEPHLLVRWYPPYILPDEWIPQCKYVQTKTVPFRQLPSDKLRLLFPHMFPPERREKAKRKWKPNESNDSSSSSSSSSASSVSSKSDEMELNSIKTEESKFDLPGDIGIEFEEQCESCNCNSYPNGCKCLPLDPDWAEFLTDQCWP